LRDGRDVDVVAEVELRAHGRNPILRFFPRADPPGGSFVAWEAEPRRKRQRLTE
jgi:hypothetical protein